MKPGTWGLVPMVLLASSAPVGAEGEAWNEFKGQVVVSNVLLAPSFVSDQLMIAALHRVKCSEVTATHGFWRLHLVAFLDRSVDAEVLRVVARDVTATGARPAGHRAAMADVDARRAVKVFEVEAQPSQKILQVNDLVLSATMGFERGHDYELTVEDVGDAPAVGPEKRDVHARGVVTLR
jgi:hypothetical protein